MAPQRYPSRSGSRRSAGSGERTGRAAAASSLAASSPSTLLYMRVCIHRGAAEIGGNVVEVEHERARVVLDVGLPLTIALDDESLPLTIGGLVKPDNSLLGIIITHGHPDHYGLIGQVDPEIPVYVGAATARILAEAAFFSPMGARIRPTGQLADRKPFELGPFRITPFLVDHSAFDAYALLVEAGGRRLFYSGDLRGHGRKQGLFERLISNPPPHIDALLVEGTRIGEADPAVRGPASESDVEENALETIESASGLVLAMFSPQNVDRLVSIYRAARRAKRLLVLDLYGAAVAAATGATSIPQASWDGVRVYVPQAQRLLVKRTASFDRVRKIASTRIYAEELAASPQQYVVCFRQSMGRELERAGCLGGASAIWSMWPGYLRDPSGERLQAFLKAHAIPLVIQHASGHATAVDLARLVQALAPTRVVPIHTATPEAFAATVANVEIRSDGEWWPV